MYTNFCNERANEFILKLLLPICFLRFVVVAFSLLAVKRNANNNINVQSWEKAIVKCKRRKYIRQCCHF